MIKRPILFSAALPAVNTAVSTYQNPLALSELITESNGTLPIMLDDSLAQFDDKRQKIALEYLKNYSKDNQIIMFTCYKYISDTAKDLGAKTQNM